MPLAPDRWERVKELFAELIDLPRAERGAFLVALAPGDADIRDELAELVRAADSVGERFECQPTVDLDGPVVLPDLTGRRVGPYLIAREVGRGGMGTVYEAHRVDDQFRKRVAIKMVAAGVGSEQVIRRFRRERQLLARLEHRNISTLLDGGVTEDGQPYFVMEFVDGQPIDRWCDQHGLGVRSRIELFRQVCTAVQYAHEHLVVHRDLKPGNILVGDDGTVKLLDFGVAKLLDPSLPGDEPLTQSGVIPMTAAYASPEQLRGDPVATSSDIYSLGVVLYELVAGRRPFPATTAFAAVVGAAERTPPLPSRAGMPDGPPTRESPEARRRRRELEGEIDSIVLMAMRPEVSRRYRSAQQLSDDLQRHLSGQRVVAQPDTLGYRTAKFVRRNRVAVVSGALAATALVAATSFSLRQASLARDQRDRAVLEAERTTRVTQFFQDVLSTPKPSEQGRDITVVEAIDAVIPRIDSTFAASPDIRAAIKNTLGSTLHDMGLYDRARPLLVDALRILDGLDRGTVTRERADAIYNLAGVENETGESARAESLYVVSLAMYAKLSPADSTDVYRGMINLATAVHAQGRLLEAAALHGRVAAWLGANPPDDPMPRNVALINQATALTEVGRYRDAEPLFREVITSYERLLGPEHIRLGQVLQPLAGALLFQEKYAEAEVATRRAWSIYAGALGETNATTVTALRMLVNVLMEAGRCSEAVPLAERIIAMRGVALPETDASIGTALLYGGWCRAQLGQVAIGERQAREGLTLRLANFPASHWAIAQGESIVGDVLARQGTARHDEAVGLLRSGYAGLHRELDSTHVRVRQARARLDRICRVAPGC